MHLMLRPVPTMDDAIELADDLGLDPAGSHPGGPGTPLQISWCTRDRGTTFTWVEDSLVRLPWVLVEGPGADPIVAEVRRRMGALDPDEALAAWGAAGDDVERELALCWATLLALRGPDDRVVAVFAAAFAQGGALAAQASRQAVRAPWPAMAELLERVAAEAGPGDVHTNATTIAAWIRGRLAGG